MVTFSRALLPVVALSLAVLGGCHTTPDSTMRVKTHSGVVSNVARYHTYSHETATQAPVGYTGQFAPEVLEKVRQDIDLEMQKRGYVLTEANGDLVVRISGGVRMVQDEPTGGAALAGAPVELDRIGALVVDIFDRKNQGHLFHGYARDELRGEHASDAQIKSAVTKLLEPLPTADHLK